MERKLLTQLVAWKNKANRKPLILEGARQVGKTYLLREQFAKNYFKNSIYVNFERADADFKELFDDNIQPARIIEYLSLKYQTVIKPNETLIIFDEIQELPRALTSLKYFNEEASEYAVVAAGSLLGIAIHDNVSFPVGKVDRLRLEPLDLEEFYWALGLKNEFESVRKSLDSGEKPMFADNLRDTFQIYLAIGGMPEAVKTWVLQKDINLVDAILKNILADYSDDFGKHASASDAKKIAALWRSVPAQFAKENHKFTYKIIESGARGRDYSFAFDWLIDAGLVHKVALVPHGDKLPLKAYATEDDFKLYCLDVGILRVLAELPSSVVVGEDDIWSQFGGAFAEQFVLQQLVAGGHRNLFYWVGGAGGDSASKGRSEVDFVVNIGKNIIPIEVKSGTNVKARSLRVYRDKYNPRLSVRFSLKNLEYNDGLLNIPLYYSPAFDQIVAVRA
jgi:predicted AAA+ superfamily ATPase